VARSVQVGSREYRVQPFNGRKAILAARMISRLSKKVPEALHEDAAFSRRYADENAITVTRSDALAIPEWRERLADMTEADWDAIGGEIKLRATVPAETRLMAAFPLLFEQAEEDVLQLLALLVIPNGDLRDAAAGGDVKLALKDWSDELLDEGSIGELTEVIVAGLDELRSAFEGHQDAVGKLRRLWATRMDEPISESESEPQTSPSEEATTPIATSDLSPTSQPSPIDSPAPTDGEASDLSTASASASYSGSPAG
jgi:hypothetical protein